MIWHVIVDCYPAIGTEDFEEYACAAISCWVAASRAPDPDFALRIARSEVTATGWVVVDTIEINPIDIENVRAPEVRKFLLRADADGFAFEFHQVPRQAVPGHPQPDALVVAFAEAVTGLATGAFTYLGSKGEQAWGYLGDEPVFPIWSTAQAAAGSADEWPSCQLAMIDLDQLAEYLHEQYVDEERMLMLGFEDGAMTVFHPLALRDAANTRFSFTASRSSQ
jgi:hypothetical protein